MALADEILERLGNAKPRNAGGKGTAAEIELKPVAQTGTAVGG